MNNPLVWLLIAVAFGVLAAFLYSGNTKGDKSLFRHPIWKALVPVFTILSSGAIWYAQALRSQQWSSQVVFEASVADNKELLLRNIGLVEVEDITVHLTTYNLSGEIDKKGHLYFNGLDNFSVSGTPYLTLSSLGVGKEKKFYLDKFNAIKFVDFDDVLKDRTNEWKVFRKVYCFRIGLKSSITKRRYSYYVLRGAVTRSGFPVLADFSNTTAAGGGPVNMKMFQWRAQIRKHQAGLFDEPEGRVLRDWDLR